MHCISFILSALLVLAVVFVPIDAGTKKKPHGHNGSAEPFTGKLLPMKVTKDQEIKLGKNESVLFHEKSGKSGKGIVIQDIYAPPPICLNRIRALKEYPKFVDVVKTVDVYEDYKLPNGTVKTAAEFNVRVLGLKFGYYLLLTFEPKYNTVTWTLDYRYNSDFDDNVGHWQVLPHPTKSGWSRVLYSTKVKLFPWIPEFVVNFLTKKALVEATTWVKRESEKLAAEQRTGNTASESKKSYFPSWLISGGATNEESIAEEPKMKFGSRMLKVGLASAAKSRFFRRPGC